MHACLQPTVSRFLNGYVIWGNARVTPARRCYVDRDVVATSLPSELEALVMRLDSGDHVQKKYRNIPPFVRIEFILLLPRTQHIVPLCTVYGVLPRPSPHRLNGQQSDASRTLCLYGVRTAVNQRRAFVCQQAGHEASWDRKDANAIPLQLSR